MRLTAHEPLRELTEAERAHLAVLLRATSERADVRQRVVALLAVTEGQSYEAAARRAGYAQGYTVSRLVQRVNQRGLAALEIAPGRGRTPTYSAAARQQILDVLQQPPERASDQSATWSLTLVQRRLRANGLPQVSRDTIHQTLRQAGYRWQRTRSWCPTGTARRKRQRGVVTVTDPAAEQKRGGSSRRTRERKRRGEPCTVRTKPGRIRPCHGLASPGNPSARRASSPTNTSATARPSC